VVKAVHGLQTRSLLPPFVGGLTEWLRDEFAYERLVDLYGRYVTGDGPLEALMRSAIWSAAAKRAGHGLRVDAGAGFKHLDTCQFGEGVFIGAQSYIQGRFDGSCIIGAHVWIGPQSYFDARDLVIEDYVGVGSDTNLYSMATIHLRERCIVSQGAHLCAGTHDYEDPEFTLYALPITIGEKAWVCTEAFIGPGVTIGDNSVIGARAVVVKDIPPGVVAAGNPARVIKRREMKRD